MKALQTMACAFACALSYTVLAQANPPENDIAAATASQLTYRSAFHDYRPYEDVPVADWRQVNNTVRHAATKGGGHGGHGAQQPQGLEGSATSKEAVPSPASGQHDIRQRMHGDQGMHGGHQ